MMIRQRLNLFDPIKVAVMGKDMHMPPEFTDKRLGIGERYPPPCGLADVREYDSATQVVSLDEIYPLTIGCWLRFFDESCISIFEISDAPPIAMRAGVPSMSSEGLE